MKKDNATTIREVEVDLLEPPHIIPILMEMFAGDRQQALSQQNQLLAHLIECQSCRSAVLILLSIAQEYDRRNNDSEEPAHDLLTRFASIECRIKEREYERFGTYIETIVAEGQDKADLRFPEIAAHLRVCSDCSAWLLVTIALTMDTEQTAEP
ncbi:MAG TPA: hypothetical protein VJ761_23515 [Ktedonobacteraceae bacterium]|nr:hypothetical protein [Ktedonobacteraceae bacterium]